MKSKLSLFSLLFLATILSSSINLSKHSNHVGTHEHNDHAHETISEDLHSEKQAPSKKMTETPYPTDEEPEFPIVYTPRGTEVIVSNGIYLYQYTEEEVQESNEGMATSYPNAIRKADANTNYNCHSFAWYSQDIRSNHYWMDDPSEYIHDGSYVLSDGQPGDIMVYYNDFRIIHSAIVLERMSGTPMTARNDSNLVRVISKWGKAGLYEHIGNECGYVPTDPSNYSSAEYVSYYRLSTQETIKSSDYGFDPQYYFDVKTKSVTVDDLTFNTKRLRTGYIEKEYVVMSPRRASAGTAYLEYTFTKPISRVEVDLALWSATEVLVAGESTALLQFKNAAGLWITKLDLLSDIQLTTNRNNPVNYAITFDTAVTELRFYSTAPAIGTSKNTGRLCIGNLTLISAKEHEHSYDSRYEKDRMLGHKSYCICGLYITEAHYVPVKERVGNFMLGECVRCGAMVAYIIIVDPDHDYTHSYENDGAMHKAYCICGEYVLRPHNVPVKEKVGNFFVGECIECGEIIFFIIVSYGEHEPVF